MYIHTFEMYKRKRHKEKMYSQIRFIRFARRWRVPCVQEGRRDTPGELLSCVTTPWTFLEAILSTVKNGLILYVGFL